MSDWAEPSIFLYPYFGPEARNPFLPVRQVLRASYLSGIVEAR